MPSVDSVFHGRDAQRKEQMIYRSLAHPFHRHHAGAIGPHAAQPGPIAPEIHH